MRKRFPVGVARARTERYFQAMATSKQKKTRTATPVSALARMREICLALPGAHETLTWGEPHFRVGEKIFAGCGGPRGEKSVGFKLEKPHAKRLIESDPRFSPAPYVGKHGWVAIRAGDVSDWEAIRPLVEESYRLIAPKRVGSELDARLAPPSAKKKKSRPSARKAPRASR
jgi:predicted DNA-binding protein (MmcQ/YjbR family)